jgi:hypothetical protein
VTDRTDVHVRFSTLKGFFSHIKLCLKIKKLLITLKIIRAFDQN